jgi:hypothetical protein
MQQCATLGSARLSLLVWNDSACPTTARELPQRTPAIVPQQESERSGIDGRRLLLSAHCRARGENDRSARRGTKAGAGPGHLAIRPGRKGSAGRLFRVRPAKEPSAAGQSPLMLLVLSVSAAVADDLCWILTDERK